jgi:hypothetical protein
MSTHIILVEPRLAVASPKPKQAKPGDPSTDQLLMGGSGLLLLLLIGLAVFTKLKLDDLSKKLKFEDLEIENSRKNTKWLWKPCQRWKRTPISFTRETLI